MLFAIGFIITMVLGVAGSIVVFRSVRSYYRSRPMAWLMAAGWVVMFISYYPHVRTLFV